MDSFWDYFWLVFACFAFAAYVMVLFSILADLFRDHRTSGWVKAVWVFFLFVLPVLGELIYLIVRGRGMVERSAQAARGYREAEDAYIRDVAGSSPDRDLATAQTLLDTGVISEDEYRVLADRARGAD
ncbi:PLD nuclease N-terminal domain-containing protein [Rhodococcus sp. SGAir0479]|uniref:PLD nuclease N-terminal domain-containing protein n=1 Tax=Rhodococcus sp. SGAir0479 TaxID=2567884 RepID=UPI0010CCEFA6|nr:PLD nuclease N-terminal domain-containing protein [Rhodococcus sp. SGAir0479]QCQ91983.1 PLDc_N domain-containing protein [Rhodococcus sp. SGAir0479]